MLAAVIVGSVGIVLVVLGYLLWKKERMSLLHDYHYDKVSEEHKKAFCTLSGWGVIAIGAGLLISAVVIGITGHLGSFIPFAAGLAIGLTLLVYAGNKYNRRA